MPKVQSKFKSWILADIERHKYHCLFLCPGQYLVYFTAFSQLVRLPSWPHGSCVVRIILRVQMVFKNRNIVWHNLHTFSWILVYPGWFKRHFFAFCNIRGIFKCWSGFRFFWGLLASFLTHPNFTVKWLPKHALFIGLGHTRAIKWSESFFSIDAIPFPFCKRLIF